MLLGHYKMLAFCTRIQSTRKASHNKIRMCCILYTYSLLWPDYKQMSKVNFTERAKQQSENMIDYMCAILGDTRDNYILHISESSQYISHKAHGQLIHNIRIKSFLSELIAINNILCMIIARGTSHEN